MTITINNENDIVYMYYENSGSGTEPIVQLR